jgi:serine/threonine-protein kinase
MISPQTPPGDCPVEQVELLAQGSADQPVPEELCRHLEQCADCRARLEGAAAPEIDWARVRRALKEQPAPEEGGEARGGLSFSLLRLLGPSDDPSVVGKIGPFEVTEVIGSGGMGMVLKARDPALDRHVAIKILAPHLASSATARRRFAREARAAAAVIHDHVIAIYQVSEHHELPYLVMPYLPDPSLQQRLDRDGKLDLESALSIGLQVAGGLEAAHAQGLIHRDVKPANVLLAKGTERAIITDFGLARAADDASLTSSGVLAGTPHYMSPEQARGEPVDFRSDLFSLGSLLFAMLAGQPPVNRELGSETIRVIGTEPMPRLRTVVADAPEWVERLVSWLHQARAEDRPESARQVAETLEQCLKHVRNPQAEGLPERLTRAEETEMGHPNDKRLFSLIALGLFLAVFLTPPLLAMTTRDEWALAFGGVAACLALFFGCLSWGERVSRVVVKTLVSLVVLVGVTFLVFLGIFTVRNSGTQVRLPEFAEQERAKAEKLAAEWVKQKKGSKEWKAGPVAESGMGVGGMPGMGGPPGGMAGPGAGMPGMGMSGPPGMGALIGSAAASNGIFAEELKKALGEEVPVPEWKKPKYTPVPQISGTWVATKAYLNGVEFKSKDKGQGIAMVCYGESIVIRMGRNFNQPELELGSGQIRMVPGGKEKTFMVHGYTEKPNAIRKKHSPIFCTYQLDDEKMLIAFSESDPKLGPAKGQDYYEFKAFSKRFPEEVDVTQTVFGKKFFCSSEDWVSFPLLKGVWFCESAQFCREASLSYSKLDPKRFVLTSDGNGLILYFQTPRLSTGDRAANNPKIRFPSTTWYFHAWSPGGKGPIEAGKIPDSGKSGIEFLNYQYKGAQLQLTMADSIDGLGQAGKNDVFVFKKVAEKWFEEEWQGEKLAKKLEIHAQKGEPMGQPDLTLEKPKDGGKESGKPKETPPGKVPEKAVDGKEKGM